MAADEHTPLRIGLIGSGMVTRAHVAAFKQFPERVQLVAVCDIREEAAREVAEMVGGAQVFTDYEELLETAEIDAVDICTPHWLHAPQAIAAAKAGKHILVEKPMACSVEEARAMVDAADAASVTLMVGQPLRYVPANVGARDAIAAGMIGDVWAARGDDWFPREPPSPWMRDAKLAGGGVLHMGGTHRIDLFRFYLGDVASVRAKTWTDNPNLLNGAEDRVLATLEFESGAVAHLSACWAGYTTPHFFQYLLLGTGGALHSEFQDPNQDLMTRMLREHHAPPVALSAAKAEDGYVLVPPVQEGLVGDNAFVNEIIHFADCVRDGSEPLTSGRDNIGTMKVVYGCYESARTGRDVRLADL